MKVLDASVITKWYKEESDSEEALQLRAGYVLGDFDIVLPDLALYELANCIRFSPGISEKDLNEIMDNFFSLDIPIAAPNPSLLKSAVMFSCKHNVTVYDAVYLALAKTIGAELVTADKKFYERVKEERGVKLL